MACQLILCLYEKIRIRFKHFNIISRIWQAVSRDSCTAQLIEIDSRFDSTEIIQYLNIHNVAQSLKITNVVGFDWVFDILVNSNLRRLHLDRCRIDSKIFPSYFAICFPLIQEIKVTKCDFDNYKLNLFFKRVGGCFINSVDTTDCQFLEEIEIDERCKIHARAFQLLLKMRGSKLTKVSINGSMFEGRNFTALNQCPRITDLQLFCMHDMTDLQLLKLKKLPSLRTLCLKEARNVSANAFIEMFQDCVFPHLQCINLKGCINVLDDTVILITRNYPKLKSLDVSFCGKITDDGVMSVVENCRYLERLNVAGNENIRGTKLNVVSSRRLHHLKYLNISGCK